MQTASLYLFLKLFFIIELNLLQIVIFDQFYFLFYIF